MPYYDPAKSDIEPPKEAKSHASFRVVVAISEYLDKVDYYMEDARIRPAIGTIGNLANVLKQLWLSHGLFTIMEDKVVKRVDRAFHEFALWYERYTTHPMKRMPYYSNKVIQEECHKRLEDIYRTICEGLQDKQWLFKIEERGRQDLATRIELIEAGVYGDRGRTPKANVSRVLRSKP